MTPTRSLARTLHRAVLCLLAQAAVLWAGTAAADAAKEGSRFFDNEDGWFDVSGFLDTAYGFVPLMAPITEPAVGYGAAGALIFIDRDAPGQGQRYSRPNIAAVGGVGTENGTRGLFAGHMGNWLDGNLRTLVGAVDADVNLDFFGLGGDRRLGDGGVAYSIAAKGGLAGASCRVGETPFWLGLRYAYARTSITADSPLNGLPGFEPADLGLHLAALTPSLTFDTRDNFFTPTQGWYVDLSLTLAREALGSDRDFERGSLTAIYHRPIDRSLFVGVRGSANASSDGTPFYLRPFVMLRGVQMLRYQGEQSAELEAELRWQLHPRFSLVGFAGVGAARSDVLRGEPQKTVAAGGAGFRYLIAKAYGLHMGLDLAIGPDEPIVYVVFGSAWMRP